MRKLMKLLREKDPSLHKDMVNSSWAYHNNTTLTLHVVLCIAQTKKGIDPTFYVFCWITLLLSQEILLPGEPSGGTCLLESVSLASFLCRGDSHLGLSVR